MAKVDLVGVPEAENAQLWYYTSEKKWYIVYDSPDAKYDFKLMYEVTDPKAIVPPGTTLQADRIGVFGGAGGFLRDGALVAGTDRELANFTEHPFAAWQSLIDRQAEVRPWLRDEEVLALLAEALLEGRELTEAEFQTTDWWKTHNAAQRQWLLTAEADPSEATRIVTQNRTIISGLMKDAGVNNAPSSLVNWIASQFTQGNWDATYLNNQIKGLADPYAGVKIDAGLKTQLGKTKLDTTREGEQKVRDLLAEWLGPRFGAWNQKRIEQWAGKLRNDPDAELALVDMLKKQRLTMFSAYDNPNLSYADIAEPWKNFVTSIWGQTADETDPFFTKIVQLNDSAEAGKLLRQEGLKRGIGLVEQALDRAVGQGSGGPIRRAVA